MVVVTDGQSQDDVFVSSENMRANGVIMAAVGYAGASVEELNEIANDPDESFVFLGNSANDLLNLAESLTQTICTTQPANRALQGLKITQNDDETRSRKTGLNPEFLIDHDFFM